MLKLYKWPIHFEALFIQKGFCLHQGSMRIRESVRRVNPEGVAARRRKASHRRRYHVKSPNALCHNHKLIKWHIVIHGGIDGFSQLVVFLKASPNNESATVLNVFTGAIEQHGLPSCVRSTSDMGTENVLVAMYIILKHPHRGPGKGSMLTGRSVHNQRIECLWRDERTNYLIQMILALHFCFYG